MPSYEVKTPHHTYQVRVERGALGTAGAHIPPRAGKIFVVTTADVWDLHGAALEKGLVGREVEVLHYYGGEERKRLAAVEELAEQMVARGADRSSIVLAFGGGIVGDLAGFLASIFMRGIPVIQAPTTLLAQVDAAVGGKTGANLQSGKNLIGAFHQPLVVLIDPNVIATLDERQYRAGLYEVIKHGVIRSRELFVTMATRREAVLARQSDLVDYMISESVRIKTEVVSADEREADLRRILNFGHTFGHALEAETNYEYLLHGEAVGFGMKAAAYLAEALGRLPEHERLEICRIVDDYGPLPPLEGINPSRLVERMQADKKTLQGKVHFVLPSEIGSVVVVSGVDAKLVEEAVKKALRPQ